MNRVTPRLGSAQKPCMAIGRVFFGPIVWTSRKPPESVPSLMAARQVMTTQNGTWNPPSNMPCENSRTAMIPMVFCASLPPWPSE